MDAIQDMLMQYFQDMDEAFDTYAKSRGLNYLSLLVLEAIFELGDGCTQKQISDDTRYPKQSVNLAVRAFLDGGLVELKELPENRKNKGITLTAKGRQLCEAVVVPLLQQETLAMGALTGQERGELVRLLGLYANAYCSRLKGLGPTE